MNPRTESTDEDLVTFSWEGEPVTGYRGEPVAVALWRAGIRVQTRSIKFHRPRGPQCFRGDCPGCMVRIDGVPNAPGCRRPVQPGLTVEGQVGIPSVQRDVLNLIDDVFPHFDHERSFVRPRLVRTVYQAIARQLAGFGQPPTGEVHTQEGEHLEPDVLVIGGGPAGLAAAQAAGEHAGVLHVDEDGFGGSLRHTPRRVEFGETAMPGPAMADHLLASSPEAARRAEGTVFGIYEDTVAMVEREGNALAVHTLSPGTIVLAVGASEGAALVDGNDLPGVLGARAARILLNRYGVPPGDPIVVVDPGREGEAFTEEAQAQDLTVDTVYEPLAIAGDPEVEAVRTKEGPVPAQAVVVDPGLTPAPELGRQAGIPYVYEDALGGRVPLHGAVGETSMPGVFVAGSCAGVHPVEAALLQGRWAGEAATGRSPEADQAALLDRLRPEERDAVNRVWRQA